MKEIVKHLTNNECYISNGKRTEDRGVLIHDTATPGATPETFVKSWNTYRPNGRQVCVHAFSDNKKVINTLPYSMRCWGCGSGKKGSGNNLYIQIEMCDPSEVYFENGWNYKTKDTEKTKKYIEDMVDITADWAANRLRELGITEVNKQTVTSHYEACEMGIGSNHGDPKGLLSLAGLTMDSFRDKVREKLNKEELGNNKEELGNNKEELGNNKEELGNNKEEYINKLIKLKEDSIQWDGKQIPLAYKTKEYKVKQVDNNGRAVLCINDTVMYAVDIKYCLIVNKEDKDTNFRVKVNTDELNIRSGPGTSYDIVSSIKDYGVYTIIEVNESWGRLKSGIGWINLTYTKRV